MAQTINADDGVISGSTGLKFTADTTSSLALQTNGTTKVTIDSNGSVTIPNATSTSVTNGALLLTGTSGAIVIDSSGHKRISWNDGGGNFNIRAGHYYNGGLLYLADGATNGGAASITMSTDGQVGAMSFNVAPIGVGGTTVTWSNNMNFNATGLAIGYGLSPSYPLHISMATGEVYLNSSTGTNYVRYTANNTGGSFQFGIDNSAGSNYFGATPYGRAIFSDGAYPVGIFTNGTLKMVIDSSGNVGVNTASPSSWGKFVVKTAAQGTDGSFVTDGTQYAVFRPNMGSGNNNSLVQAADLGIVFTAGTVNTGNFVIAPWNNANAGGIRITAAGDLYSGRFHYRSVNTAVTAAGATQGTATALAVEVNHVTTVAASTGVILPTPAAGGIRITVRNGGANALNVYPHSGGNIAGTGTNVAISVDIGTVLDFIAFDTTNWYIPSAVLA